MAESTDRAKPCGAYDTGASDVTTTWYGYVARTHAIGCVDLNTAEHWYPTSPCRAFVTGRS